MPCKGDGVVWVVRQDVVVLYTHTLIPDINTLSALEISTFDDTFQETPYGEGETSKVSSQLGGLCIRMSDIRFQGRKALTFALQDASSLFSSEKKSLGYCRTPSTTPVRVYSSSKYVTPRFESKLSHPTRKSSQVVRGISF